VDYSEASDEDSNAKEVVERRKPKERVLSVYNKTKRSIDVIKRKYWQSQPNL
jgi:hypothetical protein